jgi:hypothetical protein
MKSDWLAYIMGLARPNVMHQSVFDLFLQREAQSCDLLKATYALEDNLRSSLIPLVQRRRSELERLRARLAAIDGARQQADRLQELERENAESRRQIEELRARLKTAERMVAELETRTKS